VETTRVGVSYAKEDAYLPYRFFIEGNVYVSKGKGL
jgi:DNA-3-methyladenine glycosylase